MEPKKIGRRRSLWLIAATCVLAFVVGVCLWWFTRPAGGDLEQLLGVSESLQDTLSAANSKADILNDVFNRDTADLKFFNRADDRERGILQRKLWSDINLVYVDASEDVDDLRFRALRLDYSEGSALDTARDALVELTDQWLVLMPQQTAPSLNNEQQQKVDVLTSEARSALRDAAGEASLDQQQRVESVFGS